MSKPEENVDAPTLERALDERGWAVVPALLSATECRALAAHYEEDSRFRKTVNMARHRFGEGQYRYFDRPLPDRVRQLRTALYPPLATIANRWSERLRRDVRFPATHEEWLARCHAAGQSEPTPLLLRYESGGYNCLHRDLYGELVFPLQVVVALSRRNEDYEGGDFLLVEQRPRMQSIGDTVPLQQGDAVVFPCHERPVAGGRGHYRVQVRHGVTRVRSGLRLALGIIFHDAEK